MKSNIFFALASLVLLAPRAEAFTCSPSSSAPMTVVTGGLFNPAQPPTTAPPGIPFGTAVTINANCSPEPGETLTYSASGPDLASGLDSLQFIVPSADRANGANGWIYAYITVHSDSIFNLDEDLYFWATPIGTATLTATAPAISLQGLAFSGTSQITAIDTFPNSTLVYTVTTQGQHGEATVSSTGLVEYVSLSPPGSFTGSDSIGITVTDNHSRSTQITISVDINPGAPASAFTFTPGGSGGNSKDCSMDCTKKPVNLANGALWHQTEDFFLRGRTPTTAIDFVRTYTGTSYSAGGDFGTTWHDPFESKLFIHSDDIVWIDENGGAWKFLKNGDGSYQSPSGTFNLLTGFSDHYELRKIDASVLRFSATGSLLSITDRHGDALTLSYDGQNRLSSISAALAGTIQFTRDSSGRVAQVLRVRDNLAYSYTYDANNNLLSVTDPHSRVTSYGYDSQNRLTSVTDPLGRKSQFTYYPDGRAFQQYDPAGGVRTFEYSDSAANPHWTKLTEIDGQTTKYFFDQNFHTIETDNPDGSKKYQTWNAAGYLATSTDELGFTTQYGYDGHGNLISIQNPADSGPTTVIYDQNFNVPVSVTPLSGAPVAYSLNSTGDLVAIQRGNLSITYTVDAFGNRLTTNNTITSYGDQRDSNGLLTTLFDAHNPQTIAYDSRFRVASRNFLSGRIMTYTYDDYDRNTQIVDSSGPNFSYQYDAVGNLVQKTKTDGRVSEITKYQWDGKDRLVKLTNPDGSSTRYTYDFDQFTSNPIAITDGNGNTIKFSYDNRERLAELTDAKGAVTKFSYDAKGQLLSVTDAGGHVTSYVYDGNGRRILETRPSVASSTSGNIPTSAVIGFSYDPVGHLAQEEHRSILGLNRTIAMTYDSLDRLVGETLTNGSTVEDQASFVYSPELDAVSLTSANNSVENLSFTPEVAPPFLNSGFGVSANNGNPYGIIQDQYTIQRDVTGNIARVVNGQGQTVVSETYDPAGRLLTVSAGTYSATINYDSFGRKRSFAGSDGFGEKLTYDPMDRVENLAWTKGTLPYYQETLDYDGAGNIFHLSRLNANYDLKYDQINQLVSSMGQATGAVKLYNRKFRYDELGNRLNDGASYINNFLTANKYSSFQADPDGFGQVTTETTGSATKNYSYRADGRILNFQSGNISVGYAYDALGRLVSKAANSNGNAIPQSFTYLDNQNSILLGKAGDGTIATYIDGQGISEHLAEVKNGHGISFVTDRLGSVLNSEAAGSEHQFGMFGEISGNVPALSTSSDPAMFGIAGYLYDTESGNYRAKNRQYSPSIGRWLTQEPTRRDGPNFYRLVDSVGKGFLDLEQLQIETHRIAYLYEYAEENPLKYVDPDGNKSAAPRGGGGYSNFASCMTGAILTLPVCQETKQFISQTEPFVLAGCAAVGVGAGFAGTPAAGAAAGVSCMKTCGLSLFAVVAGPATACTIQANQVCEGYSK